MSPPNHLEHVSDLQFRNATGDDLDTVIEFLTASDLPHEDVRDGDAAFYLGVTGGGREVVGVAGLEPYGTVGLLRSVVVPARHRGRGYGTALVDAASARAAGAGVERLYLLTTSADGFFTAKGFERVPRDAVPHPIRATSQFSELCPGSATCMRTEL